MMEKPKGSSRDFLQIGTAKCGIVFGFAGVILAFLLLFLGLWKTLFVVLFFCIGFFLGFVDYKLEKIKKWINQLFPPKGE